MNKVAGLGLQLYEKKTPKQVFSCKICESFKSAYFEKHLPSTVFETVYLTVNIYLEVSIRAPGLKTHITRQENLV